MKTAVLQTHPEKGHVEVNINRHLALARGPIARGAELLVFPELSLTGYEPSLAAALAMPLDDARLAVFQSLSDVAGITLLVGAPARVGEAVHIGAFLFQPKRPRALWAKEHLHPDEFPFFQPGPRADVFSVGNKRVGLAICYELSVTAHLARLQQAGAAGLVVSAVKFVRGIDKAHLQAQQSALHAGWPVLLANSVGQADGEMCAGRSAVWNRQGQRLARLQPDREGWLLYDDETDAVEVGDG